MAEAKVAPRPLSPHLQIYRMTWTMVMSVVHRITGLALYGGIALFAIWLVALASGPRYFDGVQWFFGSPVGILLLFVYTWILMHHMLGGVRHLVWDFGHGMEPGQRYNMARFTLVGSVSLTLLIWIVAFIAF
ncbi:succinate dehydrogenase, cytochrome b556 subunit [Microvirga pudoricolor]|uniref:succinate dehydrogenase, cytochrome b556 subunit n=1 Tax=Microvirga pudoricolor TaxID=2778729 RepID=UPI00194E94AC|nr:succinate dehydrogenase, cytochrome b556 subunit [Microvirga pudoricolor]MBM6593554.1 succinate dehydrogenase, cytochrome b556 subunit [Microvirga pudoricolor]